MKLVPQSPKKALKAFLKQKPLRSEIDIFKSNLIALLDKISIIEKQPKDESEEHLKNNLRDFLRDTYYRDTNAINTKDKKDLVIHLNKTTDSEVGVIIEAKRPTNVSEMVTDDHPNKKALHELILYYLNERHSGNNQLKQLVATNIYEWFIIDANYFDKHIYRNAQIKKLYETKINDKKDNPFFYEEVAKIVSKIDVEIPCIYFDIRKYETVLRNNKKEDDKELISLFKILSPQHLLKIATPNDSNSLDAGFYKELLHIIGLEEAKEGTKSIIRRKKEKRNHASLIELTIEALITEDTFHRIPNIGLYGEIKEERIFNIALELSITWINRILFLKLLEGQLVTYHQGNKDYRFLNPEIIHDFDELFKLFHRVLAVNIGDRSETITKKYSRVPYLNSSLFEISALEDQTIKINSLGDGDNLELLGTTVLKDIKKVKDKIPTLEYLLLFLDAYDFASEGTEDVQEDNKTIINASVLGKVFEKINGYKDGSIFTPGYITMYMCRQSIRLAVVEKFNEALAEKDKKLFDQFDDLKNYTSRLFKTGEVLKANEIINSLRICDPAVGSGHFLVSALNEIIAIKAELGILADEKGNNLSVYEIEIVNDELIITDQQGNGVEYKLQNGKPITKEIQRLQKTLFHEKQIIIENCLFGVDINPKSVLICRLRLWIELLKNAYYNEPDYSELETLPNIDINIKCGNSLVSRFELKDDVFKSIPNFKRKLNDYKYWVNDYKNAKDRSLKKQLTENIRVFVDEFKKRDPKVVKLQKELDKKSNEFYERFVAQKLFAETTNPKVIKEKEKLENEIENLTKQIENLNANTIYNNAFEWRFEFPEVLNDDGEFRGFDVIIGNPPYIPLEAFDTLTRQLFRNKYQQVERKYDTSVLFILEGYKLLKDNGSLSFIAPITWQTGENYSKLRQFFIKEFGIDYIINLPFNTFENAYVETSIYNFIKAKLTTYKIFNFDKKDESDSLEKIDFKTVPYTKLKEPNFKIVLDISSSEMLNRFNNDSFVSLGTITKSTQGLSGSRFTETSNNGDEVFLFLKKGNVYNYQLVIDETYLTDLSDKKSLQQFYNDEEKILIRRIVNRQDRLSVGFTDKKLVFKKDINPFIPTSKDFAAKYLLAILASRYISFLYINSSTIATKDDFRQTTLAELRSLPIKKITLKEQQPFIDIVDKILTAKQQGIDSSEYERKIDELVYQLYGITEEEKKIIEGKASTQMHTHFQDLEA